MRRELAATFAFDPFPLVKGILVLSADRFSMVFKLSLQNENVRGFFLQYYKYGQAPYVRLIRGKGESWQHYRRAMSVDVSTGSFYAFL